MSLARARCRNMSTVMAESGQVDKRYRKSTTGIEKWSKRPSKRPSNNASVLSTGHTVAAYVSTKTKSLVRKWRREDGRATGKEDGSKYTSETALDGTG